MCGKAKDSLPEHAASVLILFSEVFVHCHCLCRRHSTNELFLSRYSFLGWHTLDTIEPGIKEKCYSPTMTVSCTPSAFVDPDPCLKVFFICSKKDYYSFPVVEISFRCAGT